MGDNPYKSKDFRIQVAAQRLLLSEKLQYEVKGRKVMKKTIITVVGNDTVGIIAKVCTYLADNQVNILDISQTILQGYFNMMMIADTSASKERLVN